MWAAGTRIGSDTIEGGCAKKRVALGLATGSYPTATRAHRAGAGADAIILDAQALQLVVSQPAVVLSASPTFDTLGSRSGALCRYPGNS